MLKQRNQSGTGQKTSIVEVLMTPEISMLIVLVILCVYTNIINPAFFAVKNIRIILRNCAFIGALAIGEAFALMCGEIDLSIGCNSLFSSVVFASCSITLGWGPLPSVLAGLLAAVLIGVLNSVVTLRFGMTSWITTLATQYICKGLATVISRGGAISSLKGIFQKISAARPIGLSWMLLIVVLIAVIAEVLLRFTPVGRKVHAVGISQEASRIAGLNVRRIKSLCMIFAGFMAGVCGVLQSIGSLSGSLTTGVGNEFPAIICCAIGGVSTTGGKGSIVGAMVGVLMFQTLKNCLQTLGLSSNVQTVVTGIILLAAVSFDLIKKSLQTRRVK